MKTRIIPAVAAVSVALTMVAVPMTGVASADRITKESFGLHSFAQDPRVDAGSLRMNMWPNWRQLNPTKGTYRWDYMAANIATAKAWGFTDLLYVFGNTPEWAGNGKVRDPAVELEPGSTEAPVMSAWKNFTTKVVKRYGKDLDSYQVWNEITSPQFYQGSAMKMAKMTKVLNSIVNRHDPSATVVSGSVQTHRPDYYGRIATQYFQALRSKGWPVDVVAGHFYPSGYGGPDKRIRQIEMFKQDVNNAQRPKRVDMWDTEANFWTTVSATKGTPYDGRVKGRKAATWVARNYLDTWRTGLKRSYWYMWTDGAQDLSFPGIQMRTDTPWSTVPYNRLADWTVGSKFTGSKTKGNLVECRFTKKGKKFIIAFTTGGTASVRFSGKKPVTPVFKGGTVVEKRQTQVGRLPVKIG